MIDIHSHILPGMDDGADHIDAAVHIAQKAVEDGIRIMIATPHHLNGHYDNPASVVKDAVLELGAVLVEREVPLKVLAGQEIRVTGSLLDEWDQQGLLTLSDSRYILLELPAHFIPEYLDDILHELSLLKLVPIIAHPERNQEILRHPERLQHLLRQGALSQVTSHSITGLFGRKIQKTALDLCRSGNVHFIASDVHKVDLRPNQLHQAYNYISTHLGKQYTSYYQHNAECVVHNEVIEEMTAATTIQGGSKWRRIWKFSK